MYRDQNENPNKNPRRDSLSRNKLPRPYQNPCSPLPATLFAVFPSRPILLRMLDRPQKSRQTGRTVAGLNPTTHPFPWPAQKSWRVSRPAIIRRHARQESWNTQHLDRAGLLLASRPALASTFPRACTRPHDLGDRLPRVPRENTDQPPPGPRYVRMARRV